MATLFLICGLPGSGKTTLARQLEHQHAALRLCPDEWIAPILQNAGDMDEMNRLREIIEAQQWAVAQRVLELGANVTLENGFWPKAERESYRIQAQALGARVELRFLNTGIEELWQRLERRNQDLPAGSFHVTRADLELYWSWFEAPDAEELASYSS